RGGLRVLQKGAGGGVGGGRGAQGARDRRRAGEGGMSTVTAGAGQIGRSLPRLEGRAKVSGRAEYVHNLRLPGMLYGKIFRSTVAHGRIRRIDTAPARPLPC